MRKVRKVRKVRKALSSRIIVSSLSWVRGARHRRSMFSHKLWMQVREAVGERQSTEGHLCLGNRLVRPSETAIAQVRGAFGQSEQNHFF